MFEYAEAESEVVITPEAGLSDQALARAVDLAADPSKPNEADLQNWQIRDDQLSFDAALKAGFGFADVDANMSRRVVLRDVCRYTERVSGSTVTTWGVAVRLAVRVWAAKLDARLTLPVVAAQAQLGMVSASADMRILGFRNNEVGKFLPDFQTLDVGNYGAYTKATDAVRAFISEHPESIVPVVLRTYELPASTDKRIVDAVGTARALRAITRRRSQSEALEGTASWAPIREAVSKTYSELAPDCAFEERPSQEAAAQADRWYSWVG